MPSFSDLANTTWHMYRLTALYKFKSDAAAFKSYARALSQAIQVR